MGRTAKLLAVLVPAMAVLLALGTWQVQRLGWKQSVIADMDARLDGRPAALPAESLDLEDWRFRPVMLSGRFDPAVNFLFPARTLDGKVGQDVLTPFRRSGDAAGTIVLVHRGWMPAGAEISPPPQGGVIRAVVREPWRDTLFRPGNDLAANQWYWMDLEAMATALAGGPVAPYYLALLPGDPDAGAYPIARPVRPDLPNNHLSYALTWYALALALAVIATLLVRAERRKPPSNTESDHAR